MTQLNKNTEKIKQKKLPFFGLPKIAPYLKHYRVTLILMVVFLAITTLGDIILPLFQRFAIDEFIEAGNLDKLPAFIIAYLAMVLIQTASTMVWTRISCESEMYISRDLKRLAFNHLQTLSFSYFNTNSVGYIHSRIMSDTMKIGQIFAWGIVDSFYSASYIIGASVVMFILNWRLALLTLSIMPIVVIISAFFETKLTEGNRKVREMNSQITGRINEGITGAKTSKTLVVEEKMTSDFAALTEQMRRKSISVARYNGAFVSIVVLCCYIAIGLVLWYGGYMASNNLILIGTLSVFTTYAIGMIDPIQMLARVIGDAINIRVNIERLTSLIETEPNVTDTPEVIEKYGDTFNPKTENWEDIKGDIEFKDVDFKYPDGDEYILEKFNLKVPAKTTVAIVGETGAGKSTLVNLVCRFFEPTSGKILIDGVDYRERSQLWLHSKIGYVLQTPHLFSGTIRENLAYGNPNATDEELIAAIKSVSAEHILEKMENGLDSEVGEGGDLLSTGEKQLLSFARAILTNPSIFVLDEATSSVDTMTEKLIADATETLLHGRTSFIIAHRLSTIKQADIILVVKSGKIVERGTHDELLKAGGYYQSLYLKQFQEENTARALKNN